MNTTRKALQPNHVGSALTRAAGLGALLWGVVFAVASALYPWSVVNRPLFDSFKAVVLASTTTCVAIAYLRGLQGHILTRVILASALWPVTCVALDLVVFMAAPPSVSLSQYFASTSLSYLMIPPIVLGLAYQRLRSEGRSLPA
ncbi:MAG TPA: hypothetical protein VHP33_26355 [Polyangiaceae bacterium]|nr:hypothetical protein [Polyangiaceae bacterium]